MAIVCGFGRHILLIVLTLLCGDLVDMQVAAQFIGKTSCGSITNETLQISSRMWLKSTEVAVAEANGTEMFFPSNSAFKVEVDNTGRLVIRALPPQTIKYAVPNATQLRIITGEMTVSCKKNKVRATKELGVDLPKDSSPSSSSPTEETKVSNKSAESQATRATVQVTPFVRSSPATTAVPAFTPALLQVSSEPNSKAGLDTPITEMLITVREEEIPPTTEALPPLGTDKQEDTFAPKVPSKTPTSVLSNTTKVHSLTTVPSEATTPSPVKTPTVVLSDTAEGQPSSTLTTEVTTLSEISGSQTTPLQTVMEGSQSTPKTPHTNSGSKAWKLKDHVSYIAGGAVLLFITVLVILTICVVQKRKSRRRYPENNEDLFITSTYDETLLRNYEGGVNNIRMYSEGGSEAQEHPQELEERILTTKTEDDKSEKPRCLLE